MSRYKKYATSSWPNNLVNFCDHSRINAVISSRRSVLGMSLDPLCVRAFSSRESVQLGPGTLQGFLKMPIVERSKCLPKSHRRERVPAERMSSPNFRGNSMRWGTSSRIETNWLRDPRRIGK